MPPSTASRSVVLPGTRVRTLSRSGRRRLPVTAEWEELLAHLESGTILVTGGAGPGGHSDLARYLLGQLDRTLSRVALVDTTLGRPAVGVPGCLGLALTRPWRAPEALWFVGELDPRVRPLPTVVGTARLVQRARDQGAEAVIVDGGAFHPNPAGRELQQHLALAAGADQVVTVSHNGELSGVLRALEAPDRELYRLPIPGGLKDGGSRTDSERDEESDAYRQRRFAAHFHGARVLRFGLDKVLRRDQGSLDEELVEGRLVGLVRENGTCAALGVIDALGSDHLAVLTPCPRRRDVHHIEAGSVRLNPADWPGFEERKAEPEAGHGTAPATRHGASR